MSGSILRSAWRAVRWTLCVIVGLPVDTAADGQPTVAADGGDPFATVEIVHLAGDGLVQVALPRPLAAQLAVTAAHNVRKGRKAARPRQPRRAAHGPRKTTVKKAKPVRKVAQKKRAPKRRHVWLSTQTRVVRPVAGNVVHLHPANRTPRPGSGRSGMQKSNGRPLRIAA